MPRMNAVEAGRRGGLIGGKSKSPAKVAAARRNGFQKVYDVEKLKAVREKVLAAAPEQNPTAQPALFIRTGKKD
jgi:hypothetical protein